MFVAAGGANVTPSLWEGVSQAVETRTMTTETEAVKAKVTVTPTAIRILIVEDHPMVRRGLRLLLSLEPDFEVCGEAETQAEALAQAAALQPGVAIVDLRLKSGNGLELIAQLRARWPGLKIVVYSMHAERYRVDQAMHAGADAFVAKEEGTVKVIRTIRKLCERARHA